MHYRTVENRITNNPTNFSSYTGTPENKRQLWCWLRSSCIYCQYMTSFGPNPNHWRLTVPQLSRGPPDHKNIWGNQHCTNQVLKPYPLRGSFKRTIVSQWFPTPLRPSEIPVLTCFSVGLHTVVSQYWIVYLKTYIFSMFYSPGCPKLKYYLKKYIRCPYFLVRLMIIQRSYKNHLHFSSTSALHYNKWI